MTLNRYSKWTIQHYMDIVKRLAKYFNKSPDLISQEEIQEYLLYLYQERKLDWGTCNAHLSGLSCFYKNVLKWEERKFKLPPRPRTRKLPNILSVEEVKRLFEAAVNLKHRVFLKTVYSAGLRAGEVVKLKPRHIESDPSRMMIRIERGKGGKDRYAVLSKHLLDELRIYWQEYKPLEWLFPGVNQRKLQKCAELYDAVVVLGCDSATETIRDAVKSSDCKVIEGMEVAGIMNAQMKFRLPGNVSFENCKTVPIYRKQQ